MLRKFPNPILSQKSRPVSEITPGVLDLIEKMKATLDKEKGLGLAAPQVGVLSRVIIIDPRPLGQFDAPLWVFINPEITARDGKQSHVEGCLSLPGLQVAVTRAMRVWFSAMLPDGSSQTFIWSGFIATCLQHELDHLNGITLIDKLPLEVRRKIASSF